MAGVDRVGKQLLVTLGGEPPLGLLGHLGMTGNLVPHVAEQPVVKHTHVIIALDDGRELRFIDPRRFGRMAYLSGERLQSELLRFGVEPLQVTRQEFAQRIRGSKARIKALLLDQSVLRGVGNIYADESLWAAKIHPARTGASLQPREAEALRKALQPEMRTRAHELKAAWNCTGRASPQNY